MRRRTLRWLRAVFPHWSWVVTFAVAVQALASIALAWHGKDPLQRPDDVGFGCVMSFAGAVCYAAYRVFAFHPLWNKCYSDWMLATPWSGRKRLPMGPVHLIPQDLLMVSILAGLFWWWGKELGPSLPKFIEVMLAVSLGVYLLALSVTLRLCDEWRGAYAVWFAIGGCVWSFGNPWLFWGLAMLAYLCALAGLKASWAGFPWSADKLQRTLKMIADASKGQTVVPIVAQDALGWPFDWLSPKPEREAFTPKQDVLLGSLLFGWLYCSVSVHTLNHPNPLLVQSFLASPFVLFLFLLGIGRITEYIQGLSAPLSLTGRLITGRLIIPRWDAAWLPIWLLLILNSVLFSLAHHNGAIVLMLPWWDFRLAASALLAFGMWTQLGNAPPFRKWRLTGSFRMNPDSLNVKQKKSQWVQCN